MHMYVCRWKGRGGKGRGGEGREIFKGGGMEGERNGCNITS